MPFGNILFLPQSRRPKVFRFFFPHMLVHPYKICLQYIFIYEHIYNVCFAFFLFTISLPWTIVADRCTQVKSSESRSQRNIFGSNITSEGKAVRFTNNTSLVIGENQSFNNNGDRHLAHEMIYRWVTLPQDERECWHSAKFKKI